ncbi:hypothetical protein M407DRAFT_243434 [Tulasnella calospora MUT 4182]|uniref:Amino-acid acetyltransferase, mitochondrial n=1 Tax=Tulasnella calospora MUT 4182 TaxID=1051891 RepID=A0A0C3L0H7_9AGAM|nr:hypothetical protein M407DRAFT_243434 [Tulasnella calospora MUT 4182]
MLASSSAAVGLKSVRNAAAAAAAVKRSALSTTRRSYYQNTAPSDETPGGMNDFILSILEASPSSRDAKNYLGTFGKQNGKPPATTANLTPRPLATLNDKNPLNLPPDILAAQKPLLQGTAEPQPEAQKTALALLDPIPRRTALVKLQGPFTDRALESICRGLVYLEKLGLVSVIVLENDDWHPGQDGERVQARDDVMRVAAALESQGAKARPILEPLARLGPPPAEPESEHDELVHEQRKVLLVEDSKGRRAEQVELPPTEVQAHARLEDLSAIRSALKAGEIPVVAPLALDSFHRMVRSPRSLIGNLVTNKPAQSSSLPAYLLTTGSKAVTPHTPTLIRKGLPMRVIQRENMHEIDKGKMTKLLEASFRRTLKADEFYERMDKVLDYVIIAGDYAGACIVTEEPVPNSPPGRRQSLSYLDKFAVHPSHQGDGTVDFLWVALHDESFGCGLAHALNPNQGGKMGLGTGRDLVWRSRTNNPANRWYYERSSGHLRMGEQGEWTMFWCDAEERLKQKEVELVERGWEGAKYVPGRRGRQVEGLSFCEEGEEGRLDEWREVVAAIPSCWAA